MLTPVDYITAPINQSRLRSFAVEQTVGRILRKQTVDQINNSLIIDLVDNAGTLLITNRVVLASLTKKAKMIMTRHKITKRRKEITQNAYYETF